MELALGIAVVVALISAAAVVRNALAGATYRAGKSRPPFV
jgi:hypothetical protein